MNAAWKAAAIAELERRDRDASMPKWFGRSRAQLADELGVDKSVVTKMLKPQQTASAYVPEISKILGIPLPIHGTTSEIAELVAKIEQDEDTLDLALKFLRRLVRQMDAG